MIPQCANLALFCDGELDTADAYEFRDHLPSCNPCQARVLRHIRLCARLSSLRPMIETGPVAMPVEEAT